MEGNKRTQLILLGIFVVVVLTMFGYLALRVGSVRTSDGIMVDAIFSDAQGLIENANVRIAGIKVGVVGDLVIDGRNARIRLHLDPKTVVRKDVVATIKAKSLLGEKFIELIPQSDTAEPLETGDVITDTFVPAELPDLASQIGPLLAKIDPDDIARLVNVMGKILEQNQEEFPKVVASVSRIAINIDEMIERNGPKIDKLVDAAYESGPKIGQLMNTTQRTLDNANAAIEGNAPKLEKFVDGLVSIDLSRVDRMIGELDRAMKDGPSTLSDAREMLSKVNKMLDGWVDVGWWDLKHLARDEGILVRLMSRSDEEIQAEREKWRPPLKPAAVQE